jgi:hypothetical protein
MSKAFVAKVRGTTELIYPLIEGKHFEIIEVKADSLTAAIEAVGRPKCYDASWNRKRLLSRIAAIREGE